MPNITLTVEEGVLRAARKAAASRGASLNALVREFLCSLTGEKSETEKAVRGLESIRRRSNLRVDSRTWTRDELYER